MNITCSRLYRAALAAILALGLALGVTPARAEDAPKKISPVTGVAADPNWEEEYAYTLGVQAYVFAFPWYYNQLLRWRWVTQPPRNDRTPSMPMNTLWQARNLFNAQWREGGTPNNDTLYSIAWVDVGQEPMIVSVPEIVGRYYSICLTGYDADNFAYIGTRATGTGAGNYAIVGPNWKGTLPKGVKALPAAHTPMVFLLARTMANGPQDLDTVHRIQDQYRLTPLSLWGKPGAKASEDRNVWGPYDAKSDPLADWKTINRAMTEIPPPARNAELLRAFAKIGVGPGQDVDKASEATKRGLIRALETGKRTVTGAASYFAGSVELDGWRYLSHHNGRYGLVDDYIGRAGVASLGGIATNDEAEAMYVTVRKDATGEHLNGAHRYALHFGKDWLPPVNAFWSLTAYGMDFNLIANPIDRYSLGDRAELQRDADGGITLYIQKDSPGADKEANWLPTGDQDFYLVMRLYLPKPALLERKWLLPPITRVE